MEPDPLPGSGVSIVQPGFGGVGVAAFFPEPEFVGLPELYFPNPFGSLSGVELGRDHAHRAAMFLRQGFPLPTMDQQHIAFHRFLQGKVGGLPIVGLNINKLCRWQGAAIFGDVPEAHANPAIIEPAPGGDAVKIGNILHLR